MPLTAASSPPTSGRRRAGVVLGAAFVGSSLVAVMSPAYAEPTQPDEPSPVASAVVAFESGASEVTLGRPAPPNPVTATNQGDAAICLLGLEVLGEGFATHGFAVQPVAPGESASAGVVTGSPRQSTDVVATLTYALAQEGVDCAVLDPESTHTVSTGTWAVTVAKPDPSPSPTPTPTEEPTPTPSPTEEPTRTPTATPSEPGSPSPTRAPGGGGRESTSPSSRPGSDGVADVPTTGADIPTLPRNDAELPEVAPGSEDLAELPLVSPRSDDDLDGTEVAADHGDMGPNMAPAVLLAALLLALLLAAPLAPVRRVRVGGGYQGKRRKG